MDGRDGIFIGFVQALALIPGVSRSGATISAGLFRNFDRAAAARYSFLLSVPAVVLSGLFELKDVGGEGSVGFAPTLIATVAAFVTGYITIAWLLRYLVHHSLAIFVAYRIPARNPGHRPGGERRDQLGPELSRTAGTDPGGPSCSVDKAARGRGQEEAARYTRMRSRAGAYSHDRARCSREDPAMWL